MKKLFISCPMKGRTEENIRSSMERMHKMAEAFFDQELEAIPSYIKDAPPADVSSRVWYLGKSIELMAQADYFIGVRHCEVFSGCWIENEVARSYDIPSFIVDLEMMPDALAIDQEYWNSRRRNPSDPIFVD